MNKCQQQSVNEKYNNWVMIASKAATLYMTQPDWFYTSTVLITYSME